MWPWEHLAVGYVLYSVWVRTSHESTPLDASAVAVAFGTQFPDLVDKPLAWRFEVLPTGVSLAHSVFTATLLSVVVMLVARRYGRPQTGVAFLVGYVSHILTDALYPLLMGKQVVVQAFFWPVTSTPGPLRSGLVENFLYYAVQFLGFLTTPLGMLYVLLEVSLLALAAGMWVCDGCPGIPFVSPTTRPAES